VDTVFEGEILQGIRDYDSYLSFKFGAYMELPPEEKRKVHPVSDIKLF
jgi:lipopolysaccharide cholinephosphotransferase